MYCIDDAVQMTQYKVYKVKNVQRKLRKQQPKINIFDWYYKHPHKSNSLSACYQNRDTGLILYYLYCSLMLILSKTKVYDIPLLNFKKAKIIFLSSYMDAIINLPDILEGDQEA